MIIKRQPSFPTTLIIDRSAVRRQCGFPIPLEVSGSFGNVFLGKNEITGEEVALKELPKSVVMDCPVESIREIK